MFKHLSMRDARPVRWTGGARGADEESELVRQAIVDRYVVTYGALVADVAERLFARDNAAIGAAADIGFFRSWYVVAARRLLERLEGTVVDMGPARSPQPVPRA